MSKAKINLLTSLIILLVTPQVFSATGDKYWTLFERDIFGLDYDCKPANMAQNAKRIIDPRSFWVEKHVDISMSLERIGEDYNWLEVCGHAKYIDREKCIYMQTTMQQAMYRCLNHSKKMCRSNGGNC